MTTVLDIYEAMGYEVDHQTGHVQLDRKRVPKSFDIVLKVTPSQLEFNSNGEPVLVMNVATAWSAWGDAQTFDNELRLPVSAIRLESDVKSGRARTREGSLGVEHN